MFKSLQLLGDNPRDHDGSFQGLAEGYADVSGVRPDVDWQTRRPSKKSHMPWKIYPKPPPPHWHWTGDEHPIGQSGKKSNSDEEFNFEECEIPDGDKWVFKLDDAGVYQVYEDENCNTFSLAFANAINQS